jgi:hypothetical protein
MTVPNGHYRYEIFSANELVAIEEESLAGGALKGVRRSVPAGNVHKVEARLDSDGFVLRADVHYRRGPFARNAIYEIADEMMRGSVSALAGRNAVTAKLGRFREVDADLILFKALIISHVRARGQSRWTGRVAVVDPNTLVVSPCKQTYRQRDTSGRIWMFEPRMGEVEEIELDAEGRIIGLRDRIGFKAVLAAPEPAHRC